MTSFSQHPDDVRAARQPGVYVITGECRHAARRGRALHLARLLLLSARRCPARGTGTSQRCDRPRFPHQLLGRTWLEGSVLEPELDGPAASLFSAIPSGSGLYAANGCRWSPRDGRFGPAGGARCRGRRAARGGCAGDLRGRSSLCHDWRRRRAGQRASGALRSERTTRVAGGENARRTLQDANAVELLASLGSWDGSRSVSRSSLPLPARALPCLFRRPMAECSARLRSRDQASAGLDPFLVAWIACSVSKSEDSPGRPG